MDEPARTAGAGLAQVLKTATSRVPGQPAGRARSRQVPVADWAPAAQNVPYQLLKQALGLHDERVLEDFIITSCIYGGLLTGKLDQRGQCLRTHSAIARDVRRQDLGPMLAGFQAWCAAAWCRAGRGRLCAGLPPAAGAHTSGLPETHMDSIRLELRGHRPRACSPSWLGRAGGRVGQAQCVPLTCRAVRCKETVGMLEGQILHAKQVAAENAQTQVRALDCSACWRQGRAAAGRNRLHTAPAALRWAAEPACAHHPVLPGSWSCAPAAQAALEARIADVKSKGAKGSEDGHGGGLAAGGQLLVLLCSARGVRQRPGHGSRPRVKAVSSAQAAGGILRRQGLTLSALIPGPCRRQRAGADGPAGRGARAQRAPEAAALTGLHAAAGAAVPTGPMPSAPASQRRRCAGSQAGPAHVKALLWHC